MGITAYVEAVASEEPNASVAWSQAGVVGLELLLVVKASNPEKKLDEKQEGKRKPGPAGHIRVCWLRLWLPNPRTGRVSGPFPPPHLTWAASLAHSALSFGIQAQSEAVDNIACSPNARNSLSSDMKFLDGVFDRRGNHDAKCIWK